MAYFKNSSMSPRWESEIRAALPNCADIPQGLAFDLNDCKGTTMHRYHFLVVAPEITQPQAVWLPSENKATLTFQYEAEKGLRFWVEFEINEIEFCDCAEQVNILEPGDNLEQVLEGGITTAGAQELIVFYAMKYGIAEQVAAARLDHESEQAQKIIELVKKLPDAEHHIHEWQGMQYITTEWLVGNFAGADFSGYTLEIAAKKMLDYLHANVGHESMVGDIVTCSGFPDLAKVEKYCMEKFEVQKID